MTADAASALRGCSFFSKVTGASFERLVTMAVRRKYAPGEAIFREGDPAPGLFVVESGLVRVYKIASSGKEHVLHFAGPGMTFAEVAVLGEFPCPAFAAAQERTSCLLLPAAAFLGALRDDHRLALQVLAGMAFWIKRLVGLLEGIVLRDAAGRVAQYLLEAAAGKDGVATLPSRRKDLASHLNLTAETLSRTLRQFREAGLIRETAAAKRIELTDRAGLGRVAEGFYPRV